MPKKEEKVKEEEIQDIKEPSQEIAIEEKEVSAVEEEVAAVSEESSASKVSAEEEEIAEEQTEANPGDSPDQEFDPNQPVTVQPVKFTSFEDISNTQGEINKNLDILMDIKLQLTVELGRAELPIRKVLELTRGSIIELEKVAGEPVELYANGKLVAHGEVVVIEDNFGLRITSITDPEDRLKGIGG